MRAFFIGFLALIVVGVLSGIGILLYPLFMLLSFLLQFLAGLAFIVLCIWLLGRFIIFIWDKAFKK